jgi:tetratricopeptide (TPR) repeat protein
MKRYFAWIGLIGFLLASSLAGAEDNLNDLYENGNSAFSASDYTTATYYYGRMLESEGWDSFPQNLDVLRKLAMIDESQAQFEQAVVHYRQLIERLSSSPQNNDRSMMPYYLQRYAENLERIGRYEQAGQILWRLVRESDSVNQPAYLTLLLNNYNYQRLTDPQIDDLRALIVPALLDSVGWEFANLLFNQERHSESLELFDKLWPSNPIKACEYSNAILTLYTQRQPARRPVQPDPDSAGCGECRSLLPDGSRNRPDGGIEQRRRSPVAPRTIHPRSNGSGTIRRHGTDDLHDSIDFVGSMDRPPGASSRKPTCDSNTLEHSSGRANGSATPQKTRRPVDERRAPERRSPTLG